MAYVRKPIYDIGLMLWILPHFSNGRIVTIMMHIHIYIYTHIHMCLYKALSIFPLTPANSSGAVLHTSMLSSSGCLDRTRLRPEESKYSKMMYLSNTITTIPVIETLDTPCLGTAEA